MGKKCKHRIETAMVDLAEHLTYSRIARSTKEPGLLDNQEPQSIYTTKQTIHSVKQYFNQLTVYNPKDPYELSNNYKHKSEMLTDLYTGLMYYMKLERDKLGSRANDIENDFIGISPKITEELQEDTKYYDLIKNAFGSLIDATIGNIEAHPRAKDLGIFSSVNESGIYDMQRIWNGSFPYKNTHPGYHSHNSNFRDFGIATTLATLMMGLNTELIDNMLNKCGVLCKISDRIPNQLNEIILPALFAVSGLTGSTYSLMTAGRNYFDGNLNLRVGC